MKTPGETNSLSRFLIWGVRVYQRCVDGRPTPCRFVPTCSNYALEAFERHGSIRGSMLVVRRLVRCNPWGDHGWDPVPRDKIDAPPSPRGTPCST